MSGWSVLARELDAWQALGRRATLWWRDDDACRHSPALQRLLDIAQRCDVPVTLAAIPDTTDASLVEAVAGSERVTVVQHGYAHVNHAPAGERSAELGAHRALAVRLDELRRGRKALERLFGNRFAAILVPPWNRIDAAMLPALHDVALRGISCFGPRASASPQPGLLQVNAHVDPIAWRRDRAFIGSDAAVDRLATHLRARRLGEVDADEPTGLLTHHVVFTDPAWDFVGELCARTRRHDAAQWLDAAAVFSAAPPVTSSR